MLDVDHFIADCHAALLKPSPQMVIREFVARAVTQASEVERALGTPRRGGLFPLLQSPEHAVANPLRAFTGAIHIYGGDLFGTPRSEWTPDTLAERPFDVARARRVYSEANERWTQAEEIAR